MGAKWGRTAVAGGDVAHVLEQRMVWAERRPTKRAGHRRLRFGEHGIAALQRVVEGVERE
jgi:hypothetical protein